MPGNAGRIMNKTMLNTMISDIARNTIIRQSRRWDFLRAILYLKNTEWIDYSPRAMPCQSPSRVFAHNLLRNKAGIESGLLISHRSDLIEEPQPWQNPYLIYVGQELRIP